MAFKAPTKQGGRGIALLLSGPKKEEDSESPDMEAGEGADEAGETCKASITAEQMANLQEQGTITLDAEDGEKVELTLAKGDEGEEAAEGEGQ